MYHTLTLPYLILSWTAVYGRTSFPSEFTSSGLTSGPSSPDCRLPCPQGYLPGSCLCQGTFFPFLFPSTPCRFTSCPAGDACRVENGRAVCITQARETPSVDVCSLPAAQGPCSGSIKRVFFDRRDGTCKTFTYGGCQGNGNSFSSKSECENTCLVNIPAAASTSAPGPDRGQQSSSGGQAVNACLLPAERGPCQGSVSAYFFNSSSGQCQRFRYGGCLGNPNRFQTVQECQQTCRGARSGQQPAEVTPAASSSSTANRRYPSTNSDCNLPKSSGLCLAYFPSFFYSAESGQCEVFIYGGCQGNANRFQTLAECEQRCQAAGGRNGNGGTASPATSVPPACLQPRTVGRCRASLPRWHYDPETAACTFFYYGGCDGNDNNFDSQAACEQLCLLARSGFQPQSYQGLAQGISPPDSPPSSASLPAACSLPRVTGPCRAMIPAYYYDTNKRQCLNFVYGGCSGNDNRFGSYDDCQFTCGSSAGSGGQPDLGLNSGPTPGPSDIVPRQPASFLDAQDTSNPCFQPKVVGFCRAAIFRFFYNPVTGVCEEFIYGGCGANANNFETYEDCLQACGTI